MNTARSHLDTMEPDFSTVLKTVESYEFFERAIALCDDLNRNYDITEDERKAVMVIMIGFQGIYRTMNTPNHLNYKKLSPEEIRKYEDNYNYISTLREYCNPIKLQIVHRLPDNVLQLPYQKQTIKDIDPTHSGAKIIPFVHERVSPHDRVRALQNSIFGAHGEILPAKAIDKIREKTAKILSTDPISANLYKWDCLAANDEKFPDAELSDDMIIHAIKTAKVRKDGAFVQSIKNNLIHRAQELEKQSIVSTEKSLLLADHIKNLTPENPITLHTVTFGKCWITNVETIEHGDDAHYGLDIVLKNGNKKHINILASSCVVGDLSNVLILRSIESTKKSEVIPKKQSNTFFQKGLQKIKNLFSFGKNR